MQHLLHVERQQEELREDGGAHQQPADVGARERAQPEHPQRQERRARASLDRDEGDDQRGGRGEQPDRLARAPAVLHGPRHRVDEQHQPAGDRGGARKVEVAVRHLRPALAHQARREREHEHADRHVDEEDPRPAEGARERAAEQHACRAAAAGDRAPDAESAVAVASLVEGRRQDRERGRREQGRAEPLQRAEGDQRARRPGEPSSREKVVKSARPTMKSRRRPSRSAMRPPSSSTPPNRIE